MKKFGYEWWAEDSLVTLLIECTGFYFSLEFSLIRDV